MTSLGYSQIFLYFPWTLLESHTDFGEFVTFSEQLQRVGVKKTFIYVRGRNRPNLSLTDSFEVYSQHFCPLKSNEHWKIEANDGEAEEEKGQNKPKLSQKQKIQVETINPLEWKHPIQRVYALNYSIKINIDSFW